MIGINSFNNPFINRDANSDSINDIVDYWCNPIHIKLVEMLYSDKAIIIEGPRGCGKTTLFKYFSYKGQLIKGSRISDFLKEGKYFCLYYRLGEFNYSSLSGKKIDDAFWGNIFLHLFELKLTHILMNLIKEIFEDENDNILDISESDFIANLKNINGFGSAIDINSFIKQIEVYIGEVKDFIRTRSMVEVDFKPVCWYSNYELIEYIIKTINTSMKDGKRFKVAFVIDEMENLSQQHQKAINTYLKFVKENISFRVGTRPSGILTFDTLTNESIRENHDFSYIVINPILNIEEYEEFLIEVANKRLSNSFFCKNSTVKIENLLGKKEDIQEEIKNKIPKNFEGHFKQLKKHIPEDKLYLIKSDDKLQELLNIIKINRGESVDSVNLQMTCYNKKERKDSKEYKKYVNDYQNKYKKSLAFLLLNIANKKKSYYSVKTFAHLSSGSTRIFLQLCHNVLELAAYKCPNTIIENKMIDYELQSEAVLMVAESEMNYLKRVGPYGNEIYNFIDNLCRLFRHYHNDIKLKYPETNQFTIDDGLSYNDQIIINVARMHAFIIRKNKLQQRSIGQPKTHIYTVNRIYFPLYNISCVTRGGFIPYISNEIMAEILNKQVKIPIIITKFSGNKSKLNDFDENQIGLEDIQ